MRNSNVDVFRQSASVKRSLANTIPIPLENEKRSGYFTIAEKLKQICDSIAKSARLYASPLMTAGVKSTGNTSRYSFNSSFSMCSCFSIISL